MLPSDVSKPIRSFQIRRPNVGEQQQWLGRNERHRAGA
jgi:hypothetical protein